MLNIDKRLLECASMISGDGIVCDVGTDHAYLPAYLVLNDLCTKVIASDINDGPLKAAKFTLDKYDIIGRVELKKSDGLKNIKPDGITDVVIAGMGAETIWSIISDADWLKNGINIIAQPMTRAALLRKMLYEHGFDILNEKAVEQDNHIYTVMKIVYSGISSIYLNSTVENIGKISTNYDAGQLYIKNEYNKFYKIGKELKNAEKNKEYTYYMNIADRLRCKLEEKMNTVADIYDYLNKISPFCEQAKWDNSGLLIGDMNLKISKVLLALDITSEVAKEAAEKKAELIISHHPVIFHPIYRLQSDNAVSLLVKNNIAAICDHTPFDMAYCGMNYILINKIGFKKIDGVIESIGNAETKYGIGSYCLTDKEYMPKELAIKLKKDLGCMIVKFTDGRRPIKKVAVCTGSGGDLIAAAHEKCADALITAEIKHDQWIEANRVGMSVFDCGHFHTEDPGIIYLQKALSANFPNIKFEIADNDKDPVLYV